MPPRSSRRGKLRNEAVAAIEELKRKGRGVKRDLALGTGGRGAIAIGLHRGSGRRQVEFGIPCVVGGAATSARCASGVVKIRRNGPNRAEKEEFCLRSFTGVRTACHQSPY